MAGLVKPKSYDWKDSNVAMFGSDEDRKVKKESAETEPAWEGVTSITTPTVLVWRINKFKVEKVPKENYGEFFNGDSYIVLRVYKEEEELKYDAHFWIGKYSSQDEYGTAAYKTVELDTLLDDRAVQYRQVEGHETKSFKTLFNNFTVLKGGHDTGFRRVLPKAYKTRFFQVHVENRRAEITEIPLKAGNFNSADVFIVDFGNEIVQWNGKNSRPVERSNASQYIQNLRSTRNGCSSRVVDETDSSSHSSFLASIPEGKSKDKATEEEQEKAVLRLSDSSGTMKIDEVSRGSISKSDLTDDDVFFVQGVHALFVYVGNGCSADEKRNAMSHAHKYLSDTGNFAQAVVVLSSGHENKDWDALWN